MPLFKASATTAGAMMLGYEHRMDMPHGGLFAIIGDEGRCQPMGNELLGMAANGVNPMLRDIRPVLRIQLKAMPEVRLIQALEQLLRRRWQRPRRRRVGLFRKKVHFRYFQRLVFHIGKYTDYFSENKFMP
jgi:hypothetical protein